MVKGLVTVQHLNEESLKTFLSLKYFEPKASNPARFAAGGLLAMDSYKY
jgi:hypothetical protein